MKNSKFRFVYRVIAAKLREKRKKLGLSQSDFADIVGVHRYTMGKIESASKLLYIHELYEIAEKLELSIEDLLLDGEWLDDTEDDVELKNKIHHSLDCSTARKVLKELEL